MGPFLYFGDYIDYSYDIIVYYSSTQVVFLCSLLKINVLTELSVA